jgi:hypothetical protein
MKKYDFYTMPLGTIWGGNLLHLIRIAREAEYVQSADFPTNVLKVSKQPVDPQWCREHLATDPVLLSYLNPEGFMTAHIDRMEPFSYMLEHSDATSVINTNREFHKIHIPLITNPGAALMWRGSQYTPALRQLLAGEAHVFNDIEIHSAVNVSPELRYHLIVKYRFGSEGTLIRSRMR